MVNMARQSIVILLIISTFVSIALTSCGEYQAILKTRDNDLWYRKGLEYFDKGEFARSANLLGPLVTAYAGTSRSDTVTLYYARSLAELGDYSTAAYYFQQYVKTYPGGEQCENCQYMAAYCYYMLSPKVELDQADTETAITEMQTYLNMYPNSSRVSEIEAMMREMQDKLALKEFNSAVLYYRLGNYMGNNYRSAVIVAQNCLKRYPDTKHREDLSFLILESKYIQAERSVLSKQGDRYRDAIDEYYAFVNEFPQSKYSRRADKILKDSREGLEAVEKLIPPSADDMDYYRNYGSQLDKEVEAAREAAENAKNN